MGSFSNFAALASFIAEQGGSDAAVEAFDGAFIEHEEMAKLSVVGEPERVEMPDAQQARAAVELMIQTLFDVFRDTRMEEYARDLAWGFCNSFHVVAKRIEGREDDAAKKLGELARSFDPSEIYARDLEDTQLLCQTLEGCRAAAECMRDYASEVYRVETGHPFSPTRGSRVSSALNASMIEARDYLAARARNRREEYAPTGPVVAFSGGQAWSDHELLWAKLDAVKRQVPEMVLATTAQAKGCDAIASAWASSRGVKTITFRLDRSQGNRAAFVRNDKIVGTKPVMAVVCEGSGIQANLAQKLRQAGVPLHIVRLAEQATTKRA